MRAWARSDTILAGLAMCVLSSLADRSWADGTPKCIYDLTLLDAKADRVSIDVACDEATSAEGFRSIGDRKYWSTDAALYGQRRGRFTLELGELAKAADDFNTAKPFGDGVMITPEMLLPLPETDLRSELHLRFKFPQGGQVASALPRGDEGSFIAKLQDMNEAGPILLGSGITMTSLPGDPEVQLAFPDQGFDLERDMLSAWTSAVAESNRRFWHRSAIEHGLVTLVPVPNEGGVRFGRVLSSSDGPVVTILLGQRATPADLYQDWILVHEMLHLGSPVMRDTGAWLNEGIATFYEPVLRARAGWKSEDDVWREWITEMPRGMRAMTEIGLQNAGRGGVYWGGAIFVLRAEIEMLRATQGKMGFSDCLRAALAQGGNVTERWTTERLLALGDQMSGKTMLAKLAAAHIKSGSAMELEEIWRKLGVHLKSDGKIEYDDSAEWAWLRPLIIWGGADRPPPISAEGFYRAG